jgi:hypothetical protein
MRDASAGCFEMKAPSNNNHPNQAGDVIYNPRNPENPDSNQRLLRPKFTDREIGEMVFGFREYLIHF